MNQKTITVQVFALSSILFLAVVSLSGCTTNQTADQNTNDDVNALLGTWVGVVQMPMFGSEGNASISQITFRSNTAEVTVGGTQGSYTINYTYTMNGNTIVLQPTFNERGGFPGGQPFNGTVPSDGTRPPWNGTWSQNGTFPGNGTLPPNGTRPPGNGTWPQNGTQLSGNQRPSASISFTYRFNDDDMVIYLNESRFTRIS
jgi:hypothetical protein